MGWSNLEVFSQPFFGQKWTPFQCSQLRPCGGSLWTRVRGTCLDAIPRHDAGQASLAVDARAQHGVGTWTWQHPSGLLKHVGTRSLCGNTVPAGLPDQLCPLGNSPWPSHEQHIAVQWVLLACLVQEMPALNRTIQLAEPAGRAADEAL